MDWLTFFSKTFEALAWPVAAIVLACLLRPEIRKLAPFVKKLKAGPIEAEFEREVQSLQVAASKDASTSKAPPDTASKAFLLQLAELHSRSAILEAWVRLEAAARSALVAKQPPGTLVSYKPASHLAAELLRLTLITQGQASLFEELRRLRNEAAHSAELHPSLLSVTSYIDLSSSLQAMLEQAGK
jgi:hypothetical protein